MVYLLRIYNDFIIDFCRRYPKRHLGLANIPYTDITAAVNEVHRVAKLGVCGIELSCAWDMVPTYDPQWDPLWQAINEVEVPVHFHSFPSLSPEVLAKSLSGASRPAYQAYSQG
jgi:uncharacterized protein